VAVVPAAEARPDKAPVHEGEPNVLASRSLPPDRPRLAVSDNSPGAGRIQIVRRDRFSEEELRQQLAASPEMSLQVAELTGLVQRYAVNYTKSGGGDLESTPLLDLRPDLRRLPFIQGDKCRISPKSAATLTVLSNKLRRYIEAGAPKDAVKYRPDPVLLRETMRLENHGKKPEWLRPEAVPVLQQLLMHEDKPLRMMLIELLSDIPGQTASLALAQRAVFDLAPEAREAALMALSQRPRAEYRAVLLRGLRYPWAPAADHAAEALVALQDREAVPDLERLLDKPEPDAPFRSNKNHLVVREMVKINHRASCLLCHPPAVTDKDPVPGEVPGVSLLTPTSSSPGSGPSGAAYSSPRSPGSSGRPLLIRADVTYLRQDFSIQQPAPPVVDGTRATGQQRFDYLVHLRIVSEKTAQRLHAEAEFRGPSRQREALLFALKQLRSPVPSEPNPTRQTVSN
jgi:hypothetical protein